MQVENASNASAECNQRMQAIQVKNPSNASKVCKECKQRMQALQVKNASKECK